ncbi:hypothetical protein ACFL01_01750 [Planctomycetota bacterium]
METIGLVLIIAIIGYVAVCGGRIAAKCGKNPVMYGILSVISPVNLILLGYLAFSKCEVAVDAERVKR